MYEFTGIEEEPEDRTSQMWSYLYIEALKTSLLHEALRETLSIRLVGWKTIF